MTHTSTAIRDKTVYLYEDLGLLMSLMTGDEKHSPSATSTLDVLWVLYDRVLAVDAKEPEDPGRDRFVLSKGHGPVAFYAVLAAKGFIPTEWLTTFGDYSSRLGWHPDATLLPGVEVSSGSLGHGLAIATGMATALRAQGRRRPRVFCLVGDGELDEGSNHEAIAYAARAALDSLTVIAVDNGSSTHGWPGGIDLRFAVEGWSTATVDGRDHDAIETALVVPHPGRPRVVIARLDGSSE